MSCENIPHQSLRKEELRNLYKNILNTLCHTHNNRRQNAKNTLITQKHLKFKNKNELNKAQYIKTVYRMYAQTASVQMMAVKMNSKL